MKHRNNGKLAKTFKKGYTMITLQEIRKSIIINNNNLLNAKAALKAMDNDPMAHFKEIITDDYDTMLNEQYEDQLSDIDFLSGENASDLMQNHDPVMYRCGLNDFADSFDITNLEEYVDLVSVIEDLEGITEELEEELALLEEEENN